tara:strand:- start:1733 stop:2743 length:1011 start_codon:yes stop_codon:yes gene_type:complete
MLKFGKAAGSEAGYEAVVSKLAGASSISTEIVDLERHMSKNKDSLARLRTTKEQLRSNIIGLGAAADKKGATDAAKRTLQVEQDKLEDVNRQIVSLENRYAGLVESLDELKTHKSEMHAIPVSVELLKNHRAKLQDLNNQAAEISNLIVSPKSDLKEQRQKLGRLQERRQDILAERALGADIGDDLAKTEQEISPLKDFIETEEKKLSEASEVTPGLMRKQQSIKAEIARSERMFTLLKALYLRHKITEISHEYETTITLAKDLCKQMAAIEHLLGVVAGGAEIDKKPLPIWQIRLPSMDAHDASGLFGAPQIKEALGQLVKAEQQKLKAEGISIP